MYPFIRMGWQLYRSRRLGRIDVGSTHVSHHYCLPTDIDLWMEMNNGRALTLFDLNRFPFVARTGFLEKGRARGWGATVAGSTTRYRHRIRLFDRIEMRSRLLGRCERFFYILQSMTVRGRVANSALIRMAIAGKDGIVPTQEVADAMDLPDWNPTLPDWVQQWIASEEIRTWPPET